MRKCKVHIQRMSTIAAWILTIIAVEAITEIIVAGSIFEKPRAYILAKNNFFSDLLACGYCTSVWIAIPFGWALPGTITSYIIVDIIIKTFALHRLSNYIHEIRVNWLQGLQFGVAIHKAREE